MHAHLPRQYEELLQQVRDLLSDPTEEKLEQASDLLDAAARLLDGNNEEIQSLRRRIADTQERLAARRTYDQVHEECKTLWNQEQELLQAGASPATILERIYRKAVELAEQAYDKYPNSLLLEGLRNEARIRYERARQRYTIRTTAAQMRNYKEQLKELETEEDPEREIPWYDDKGQYIGSIKVRNAILQLTIDAQTYAREKAREYLQAAQTYLEHFQPRLAREILDKRTTLYLLPKDDEEVLAEFDRSHVEPALEKLRQAENLANQAKATQNLSEAWQNLRDAISTYPSAPAIEEARKTLLNRTLGEIEARLNQARSQYDAFCQGEHPNEQDLQSSEQTLNTVQMFLQEAESVRQSLHEYLKTLRLRCQSLTEEKEIRATKDANDRLIPLYESQIAAQQRELTSLEQYLQEIDEKLNRLQHESRSLTQQVQAARQYQRAIEQAFADLKEAFDNRPARVRDMLQSLDEEYDSPAQRRRYGELARRLPGLESLKRQIQAFEDFTGALRSLEDAFLSSNLGQIEQAIHDAEALREKYTDHQRHQQIDEILRRLRGRLHFLRGRKAWQEGDLTRAEELLLFVSALPQHPDRDEASKILASISKQREQEQEIQNRLTEARAFLDHKPERAYKLLADLANRPSFLRSEISITLERARQRWEENLLNQLDESLQSVRPLTEEIHRIADELLNLPEPRSARTNQKARQAKAKAFAIDARLHEQAGRLGRALEVLDEACRLDPGAQEYVTEWRRIRFEIGQRRLRDDIGENEILGILSDLQNDLSDDPRLSILLVEQYHRLSRLQPLDAERRLEYLERAIQYLKQALLRPDLSASERGRLKDLEQTIERENTILQQQADIEQRLIKHQSLNELNELLQRLSNLREGLSDRIMRKQIDNWWEQRRSEIIKRLERDDESLHGTDTEEQRFDIRSRIALLDPEHRLARAVGNEIINHVESLLREIDIIVDDYRGIHITTANTERVSAPELIDQYQSRVEELIRQVDVWYRMLEQFNSQTGADTQRLREALKAKRMALTTWQDRVSTFYRNIRFLSHELAFSIRSNDWERFNRALEDINRAGFGAHLATRQILQKRDELRSRRSLLEQLCQEVIDTLRSPQGDRIFDAQQALARLRDGDPVDEFGLQKALQIDTPFGKRVKLQGLSDIEAWLRQIIESVRSFGNWLYRSGASQLWPKEPKELVEIVQEAPQECVNWSEVRQKIQEWKQAGQYKIAYLLLDRAISGSIPAQLPDDVLKKVEEICRNRLPINTVVERLSSVPFTEETLPPFLKVILTKLDQFQKTLEQWQEEAQKLHLQIKEAEDAWQAAFFELEQAMEEIRTIEGKMFSFVFRDDLKQARLRYHEALLRCRQIAPLHPALKDLE